MAKQQCPGCGEMVDGRHKSGGTACKKVSDMKARAHLEGRVEGRGEILAALSEPETEKSNKLPRIVGAVVAVVVVIVILAWAFGSSKPDPAATPAATTTTTTTAKGIVIKPRK